MDYQYELDFMVRDYECDLQGIVNNANYMHYLEHARHEYLYSKNIDFAQLHAEGIDLIVSRVEMDFKQSLTSRDRFAVQVSVYKEGHLRVVFDQAIYRTSDSRLVLKAKVIGVCLRNGRPVRPEVIPGFSELGF